MLYCEYPPDRSLYDRVQHPNAHDETFLSYARMATVKLSDSLALPRSHLEEFEPRYVISGLRRAASKTYHHAVRIRRKGTGGQT